MILRRGGGIAEHARKIPSRESWKNKHPRWRGIRFVYTKRRYRPEKKYIERLRKIETEILYRNPWYNWGKSKKGGFGYTINEK